VFLDDFSYSQTQKYPVDNYPRASLGQTPKGRSDLPKKKSPPKPTQKPKRSHIGLPCVKLSGRPTSGNL